MAELPPFSRRPKYQSSIKLEGWVCVNVFFASVAELVDALDLGSSGVTRESSSLSTRTILNNITMLVSGLSPCHIL